MNFAELIAAILFPIFVDQTGPIALGPGTRSADIKYETKSTSRGRREDFRRSPTYPEYPGGPSIN